MKTLVQNLANKFGFQISRLAGSTPGSGAFSAMQRLLAGTAEPIVFDVGAHHGVIARAFRARFPTSLVYAFEPFNESFEQLKANTASDPRIKVFNFGLSDRDGTLSFNANPSSATNSLLSTHESGAQTWGTGFLETQRVVEAQFKTLDSVMTTMRIPRIDVLKLDVQGAEHLVIAGAKETCMRGMIGLIYSEIITQPTYKGQKRLDDSLAVFYSNNFDLYGIYNMSHTSKGRLRQIDALFTKMNERADQA